MKYRKLTIVIALFLLASKMYSQTENYTLDSGKTERYLRTYGKIDLSFSGLGMSFETPLADRILLEIAGGVGAGYKVDEDFKYRMYFDNPSIYTSLHTKYYYNQETRVRKGRPVSFNAGNFFALKAKYTTPTLHDNKTWHTMLAAFHWGMQRKMGRHFMYQLTVGVGGAIDLADKTSTHVTLYPDVNFRISYVLPF